MENKCNILIAHNFYKNKGGEDTVFYNEIEMLKKMGYNVFEYTRNNNEIANFSIFKKIFLPFSMIHSFKTKRDIKKIIIDNKIDIIHVHNTLNLISPSIYYIAKKMNVPIVQTIHNFRLLCPNGLFYRDNHICEDCPQRGLNSAIKHKCYRNSKLQTIINVVMLKKCRHDEIYKNVNFIFLTEFNKEKFVNYNKKLNIFDEDKFFVKPNFVEKMEVNEKDKKDQYIFVGRLEKTKGIIELIDAWKNVKNSKLIICGTGPLEEKIRKIATSSNINIEFKGFCSKMELTDLMNESKALIFSSLWYEGFPMTILEAINLRLPIIANNIGNGASIVKQGYGLLYNNDNELVTIINDDLIKDFNMKENIYSKENNMQILNNIYKKILEEKYERKN